MSSSVSLSLSMYWFFAFSNFGAAEALLAAFESPSPRVKAGGRPLFVVGRRDCGTTVLPGLIDFHLPGVDVFLGIIVGH